MKHKFIVIAHSEDGPEVIGRFASRTTARRHRQLTLASGIYDSCRVIKLKVPLQSKAHSGEEINNDHSC